MGETLRRVVGRQFAGAKIQHAILAVQEIRLVVEIVQIGVQEAFQQIKRSLYSAAVRNDRYP